ncbi:MAG: DUF3240 family protein [Xanthomonadales bacterium]|jgi:hypothetical protein
MDQLLRLNIPPSLEEDLVDFLLASDDIQGFQSTEVNGHGQVGAMSIAEQVAGRRRRVQFEIVLDVDRTDALLGRLREAFPLRDVIYWVLPVSGSGRLAP